MAADIYHRVKHVIPPGEWAVIIHVLPTSDRGGNLRAATRSFGCVRGGCY